MMEIERTGPPEVLDVVGREYRLAIPLSRVPPPAWWHLFREPGEWTSLCHPRAVTLRGQALVLDCPEEDVPVWVDYVDRWIRDANGSFAVEWKRRRAEEDVSDVVRRRRLEAARERLAVR